MQRAIENLINNFTGIRSGRASTTLVDSIVVDAYGQNMKIKDLASVSVPEARTIKINVWDTNLVNSVEKSLLNLSLNSKIAELFIALAQSPSTHFITLIHISCDDIIRRIRRR